MPLPVSSNLHVDFRILSQTACHLFGPVILASDIAPSCSAVTRASRDSTFGLAMPRTRRGRPDLRKWPRPNGKCGLTLRLDEIEGRRRSEGDTHTSYLRRSGRQSEIGTDVQRRGPFRLRKGGVWLLPGCEQPMARLASGASACAAPNTDPLSRREASAFSLLSWAGGHALALGADHEPSRPQ